MLCKLLLGAWYGEDEWQGLCVSRPQKGAMWKTAEAQTCRPSPVTPPSSQPPSLHPGPRPLALRWSLALLPQICCSQGKNHAE